MVIIDGMRLPPKKILISIVLLMVLVFGLVFSFLFKQKMNEDKLRKMQQQKVLQENNDRSSYEAGLEAMFNSANINEVIQLYDYLLKDISFMKTAGWLQDQILCTINSCNIRLLKQEGRIFHYISLKKGDKAYEPIFNEQDMTFDSILYDIDITSNMSFQDKMDTLWDCTEFITNTYHLSSLLALDSTSTKEVMLQLPTELFSFSQEYEWAPHSKLKKGILNYKTLDFYTVNYIRDKYMGQLVTFDQLMIDNGEIDVTMSYYCF